MYLRDILYSNSEHISVTENRTPALNLFKKLKVPKLPVVDEKGYCLGVVSRSKIEQALTGNFIIQEFVDEVMVESDRHIIEALRISLFYEVQLLPVVDIDKLFLGNISQSDIVTHFIRSSALLEKGSLIVLEGHRSKYSLVEFAKIIEGHGATILHHYLSSHANTQNVVVTLVLNTNDIGDILATFERYEYDVIYSSTSTEQDDHMRERYDSLMHYLEI